MSSRQTDLARVLRRVYSICQILSAGLLVVYIFGSLILVGGRIAESQSAVWPEVLGWPLFEVPAWLLIVAAAVGAAVVVPMCVMTSAANRPRLLAALAQTFAAVGAAVVFTFVFTLAGGRPADGWSLDDVSGHWIALPFLVFSIVVLLVALVAKYREYARLWKSGELNDAQQ